MSDACAISYIQYIGVVSAGLPSATSEVHRQIHLSAFIPQVSFASHHSAECVIMRQ